MRRLIPVVVICVMCMVGGCDESGEAKIVEHVAASTMISPADGIVIVGRIPYRPIKPQRPTWPVRP